MDTDLWGIALILLAGFLAGGTYAMWKINRVLSALLGACAVMAVLAGAGRLGYF
ncbi:hypothetical protein [Nocardiopsis kunsanensis]|uniref:Uncharacterized protein n=1 Tax=Nocardiopsis kunsanensis TaxID=141693 RepID=A0A918X6K0_9ACTN|nr:hypothetical protein [Nocardiopsis kunsanensis]GHD15409.1 hypothetical protein GCM10007147_02670 [Nocardiopsis kunsanensis]